MADNIVDKILSLQFVTDKKSTSDTLAQITQLRASLNQVVSQQKALSLSTDGVGNSYKKLSANAVQSRNDFLKGTTAIKEQITVLDRLKAAQSQVSSASGGGGGDASGVRLISKGLKLANTVGNAIEPIPGLGQASTVLKQAAPLIEGLGASVTELAVAAPLAGVAVVGVAIALKLFTDQLDAEKAGLQSALKAQEDYFQIIQTGTQDQVKTALDAAKAKQAGDQAALASQLESAKAARENQGILGAAIVAFGGLGAEITKNKEAVQGDKDEVSALTNALNSQAVAENTAKEAALAYAGTFSSGPTLASQIETTRNAEKTALDQMAQQREAEAQAEVDILQKGADQRIAIAEREAEGEAAALLSLQRANTDAQTKLGQQEADDRLTFQRQEIKETRDHVKKLLQIRKDEARDETELIANRDFAGLAAARRGLNQKLDDEQDNYSEAKRQRVVELKQRLQDDKTGFIREQQQRQINYQRQLSDLRAAETRDLQANRDATAKSLEQLRNKLGDQLKLEQAGYAASLKLEQGYINIRNQLLAGVLTSVAQAQSQAGLLGGSAYGTYGTLASHQNLTGTPGTVRGDSPRTVRRAGGGYLSAGQTAMVNEAGRESWSSGGSTVWLPKARGYFTPTQGGTVNPAVGGGAPQIHISVRADTRAGILKEVNQQVSDALTGIVP